MRRGLVRIGLSGAVLSLLNAGCTPSKPVTLRVMTYNIHHGHGMDGQFDLGRTVKVINDARPDLVALQEVDSKTERARQIDEPQELAERTGMQAIFGKTIDWQGGEYGIAVLSRLPVLFSRSHSLPNTPGHEPRVLMEVGVSVGGRTVAFYNTDLDDNPDDAERMGSVELFEQIAREQKARVILGGDLFGTPEHPAVRKLLGFMSDCAVGHCEEQNTSSAREPQKRIDYILYRPHPRLRCVSCEVIAEPIAAQHRPVLAVFHVNP